MKRKKEAVRRETAACRICGESFNPDSPIEMHVHIMLKHPIEFSQTPQARSMLQAIEKASFNFGQSLFYFLKGGA
jgi:hypothetical protein